MNTLNLSFFTIGKTIFKGQARALLVPTKLGYIEILPRHTELISALVFGEVIIKTEEKEEKIKIDKGVLEVRSKSEVIVLADLTKE